MPQTLVFESASEAPVQSLRVIEHNAPRCSASQVSVKMLAAPINPLDLLVLQAKYPVKPQSFEQNHPIPGYDGVAEILECGSSTTGLHVGDKVIVTRHGLGTWRTHAVFESTDVTKVPKEMEPVTAAILRMGILTAWLLLENNIGSAAVGDWIVINAATGVIAHFLMQFAAARGLQVIAVIRDRDQKDQTATTLQRYGAKLVTTDAELPSIDIPQGQNVSLGFDAVFGASGQTLISRLSAGATYIVYGFLGGLGPDAAISVTQPLIFLKSITFKGFRLSAAFAALSDQEEVALYTLFAEKFRKGQLVMPFLDIVRWDLDDRDLTSVKTAVQQAGEDSRGRSKTIISFS